MTTTAPHQRKSFRHDKTSWFFFSFVFLAYHFLVVNQRASGPYSRGITSIGDMNHALLLPPPPAAAANSTGRGGDKKPTCKSIMQDPNSPYRDGSFLTRHGYPVYWIPRVDHSRELVHPMCTLHRYTAQEARQCLARTHLSMIGDSLTRYQFLSLVHLVHKGHYPPRFGILSPCPHHNEKGEPACSPPDQPNVCMEQNWAAVTEPGRDRWLTFMQHIGSKVFDGYMEASAVKTQVTNYTHIAENYHYVAPWNLLPPSVSENKNDPGAKRLMMSYVQELGWADDPTPVRGFHFTKCAYEGTCDFNNQLADARLQRAFRYDLDFSQPLVEALSPGGVLRQQLPPADIAIYNRGYWGALSAQRANKVMPALYDFSQGAKGRCFFRATTAGNRLTLEAEILGVRDAAWSAGCGYLDFAHIVADFNYIYFRQAYGPPMQNYGNILDERNTIFWDAAHFQPWVNEELNNVLLNVLCNAHSD